MSRAVDEPPGANCVDGGTAVQSGNDADGDGLLDDAEVATTVYVCRRDQVRLVPEAEGSNCADGGTAVWIGDDVDDDGVLEQSEVREVVYLCDAVHELLTRIDTDPGGAPCPEAVAIHVGHDVNDDGELAESEVLATEYVCGEAIQGFMVINTAADLARFQEVRAVVGDLYINGSQLTEVELPNLWFVGGDVFVGNNSMLTSLRLPQLYKVAEGFSVAMNPLLEEIEAPMLRSIGDWFTLSRNAQLVDVNLEPAAVGGPVTIFTNAALTQLEWDNVELASDIEITANAALTSVALDSQMAVRRLQVRDNPQLATLSLAAYGVTNQVEVTGNAALATLRLQVGTVGALWVVDNAALTHLDAWGILDDRGLYYVRGDLVLRGSPISNFSVGFEQEGLYVAGDAELANLAVATLLNNQNDVEWVGGDLVVRDNSLLTDLRTRAEGSVTLWRNAALTSAVVIYDGPTHASEVAVWDNPVLANFAALYLRSVTGSVVIQDNPLLPFHGLDALLAADEVSIANNPMLPVCAVQALFARVTAFSETQSGNDDDGVCN